MTLMALSMAPFHLLDQDDWNEVQYDLFSYARPVMASHNTNDIVNNTTAYVKIIETRLNMTFQSFKTTATCISIRWCQWCCQWYYCIHLIQMTKTRSNNTFLVKWCHWHHHWYHMISKASSKATLYSKVKTIEMMCNMTSLVLWYHWC